VRESTAQSQNKEKERDREFLRGLFACGEGEEFKLSTCFKFLQKIFKRYIM